MLLKVCAACASWAGRHFRLVDEPAGRCTVCGDVVVDLWAVRVPAPAATMTKPRGWPFVAHLRGGTTAHAPTRTEPASDEVVVAPPRGKFPAA